MKYIGKNGFAAPRLKDAGLKDEQYEESITLSVRFRIRTVYGPYSRFSAGLKDEQYEESDVGGIEKHEANPNPDPDLQESYLELVKIMRRMYQVCRLVHGERSEYDDDLPSNPNPNPNPR